MIRACRAAVLLVAVAIASTGAAASPLPPGGRATCVHLDRPNVTACLPDAEADPVPCLFLRREQDETGAWIFVPVNQDEEWDCWWCFGALNPEALVKSVQRTVGHLLGGEPGQPPPCPPPFYEA